MFWPLSLSPLGQDTLEPRFLAHDADRLSLPRRELVLANGTPVTVSAVPLLTSPTPSAQTGPPTQLPGGVFHTMCWCWGSLPHVLYIQDFPGLRLIFCHLAGSSACQAAWLQPPFCGGILCLCLRLVSARTCPPVQAVPSPCLSDFHLAPGTVLCPWSICCYCEGLVWRQLCPSLGGAAQVP